MAAPEAWWVYCVVPAERTLPDGLEGVAAGAPPTLISVAALAAVASRVPLDEYGEEALKENLNDLGWLERMARRHESVLEQALAGGEIVPLSVCTIYRARAQVQAMLEERAGALGEALARLAGKSEWGVKAMADPMRLEQHALASSEEVRDLAGSVVGKSAGAAYIARKRLGALIRDEVDRLIADGVRDAHARLDACASAAVLLPAQNRELSGLQDEMVLNAAYLVADEHIDELVELVRELEAQYVDVGLGFSVTGPWPAYHFAKPPTGALEAVR
jgi:hypothetical protein